MKKSNFAAALSSSLGGLALVAALVVSCSSPSTAGNTTNNNTNSSTVTPVAPTSLAASGVTSGFPATQADLQALFTAVNNDTSQAAKNEGNTLSTNLSNSAAKTSLQTTFTNFQNSLNNSFLSSKSASVTASLLPGDAGGLFTLSAANLNGQITATTFDGAAIKNDSSNLQSLVGTLSISFGANVNPSASSDISNGPIRDARGAFILKAHASATASTAGVFASTTNGTVVVEVDYTVNGTLGLSVNEGVHGGGKIIANATSSFTNTQTFTNPKSLNMANTLNSFVSGASPLTVTISVYNDSNVLQNTFTYQTTLADLSSSFLAAVSS